MKSHSHYRDKVLGFTIIELIIVIGLFIFMGALASIIGIDAVHRSSAAGERDLIVTLLWGERAKALANVNEIAHGIHVDSDTVVLFEGNAYDAANPDNRVVERNSSVIAGGVDTVIFEELSGRVISGVGDITLTQGGQDATISVNSEGRIDW